jgi:hypothetical protein
MKLLAVNLQRYEDGGVRLRHRFFDVLKENDTTYEIAPRNTFILRNKTHIKKSDVGKIAMVKQGRRECNLCNFDYINYQCIVVSEGEEPNYDTLSIWRKKLKDRAKEELKIRNQALKALYKLVCNA